MSIFSQSTFRLVNVCNIKQLSCGCFRSHCTLRTKQKGLINDHFSQLQTLKTSEDPECPVRLISNYLCEVDTSLSELTRESDLTEVDFSVLGTLARKIQEKSSFIGAEHVRCACADLIQACDRSHKQNFNRALDWMKNEFDNTRKKLDSFVQMERRIQRLERKQDI